MEKISLEIKKYFSCDVLVIGGGVAGISAAVCAAREGADVILTERDGCLGGTASMGLVGPFMSAYDPKGEKQVVKGFMDEFINRMVKKGGAVHPKDCPGGDSHSAYRIKGHIGVTPFDPECFKITAEECCEEAGVKVIYHMLFAGCEKDTEGKIKKAYFATKKGIYEVRAKVFIDCTGDADLVTGAGYETIYGDENGRTQVSSIFFIIDGVDKDELQKHIDRYPEGTNFRQRYLEDIVEKWQTEGRFPCGRSRVSAFEAMNGMWRVNMSQYDEKADLTDPEDVTKAEMTCRRQIEPLIMFLQEEVPGFNNIRLLYSANTLGIRESKRIVGEYVLTIDDMANGTGFGDAICTVGSAVDFHGSQKRDGSYDGAYGVTGPSSAQIPYRCLIPKESKNLLAAGRCVSADQMAHSAVRVMPPCFAMGQAAGVAAAISVNDSMNVKDIDIGKLQQKLKNGGVFF